MRVLRVAAALALGCLLVPTADAATATYRWQVSDGQNVAGYTTNWNQNCGNDIQNTTALTVTTMTTDPFPCLQAGRITTTEPGPFDHLMMIRPTAYTSAMDVTGGTIRWYLRDADGGGVTFRILLGYAQGGAFSSFGFVDQTVNNTEGLYVFDLSGISGTAPVGSSLATMVTVQTNSNGNEIRVYIADDKNNGDLSGQLTVDETVACPQTGSLSVTPGQSLSGNPVDLTSISTATGSTNEVYTVYEGSCPTGATFDQMDDFAGLADGTRPNFGNWTGVTGTDGTLGWVALSGATGSSSTGPVSGNPNPYVYLESSGTSQTYGVGVTGGSSQYVESNVIDASIWALSFTFDWDMNVENNSDASLHVDAWNGSLWVLDVNGGAINTGSSGDVWTQEGPIDLSAFTNADFRLRIRYIVGTAGSIWRNDIAIDNLHFTGIEPAATVFTGDQTQAQTADTTGWVGPTMCLVLTGDDATCGTPLPEVQDTFTWSPVDDRTTVGTVVGVASGCDAIAVTAPFTGDDNSDNGLSYRYQVSGSGSWVGPISVAHSVSPYAWSITGLAFGMNYDVEVPFSDADGVNGANPQTVTGILVGGDCTGAGTVTAGQIAGGSPSIAVTAPYTFDNNGDNTLSYRYRLSGGGTWTAPVSLPHGPSPYALTLSSLVCGSTYDVEVTYLDPDGIGAGAAVQTVSSVTMDNCSDVGVAGATVDACDQISVSLPLSGDANTDGSSTFEQGPAAGGPWTTIAGCSAVTGVGPRTCVDTGLLENTDYYYRVTTIDPDGVDGIAQQVIGPFNTGVCFDPPVTAGTATAVPDSCSQITVTAPYTGDTNNDSTTAVEYNTTNSWPGTPACSGLVGGSPRSCQVSPLANATPYFFRVTFADPDGVNGTNPQVIGPVSTLDCRVTPGTASANVDACDQITVLAPFGNDANADSSTDFERASNAGGPWTTICSAVSGAGPRTCVDGVTESSTYFYRVTFSDPDGIDGAAEQTIGPFSTPACAVNFTNVTSNSVADNTCDQVTVTTTYSDDANGDGSTDVEYNTTNSWPGTSACRGLSGGSPRQCTIQGLNPGGTYYFRVTYNDPDGVDAPGVTPKSFVVGPLTLTACGGTDDAAPTVIFLSPTSGATVGGGERVKVQIFDDGGLAAATPVAWSVDGGALSTAVTINTNYDCGTGCSVFEFDFDTTVLPNGVHYLTVEATDALGNLALKSLPITVGNTGAVPTGDGYLLRRTHSSQMCLDCHALKTHSSQHTSTKYGNVGFECLTCHTPHRTRNVFLVRESIATPQDGNKPVTFRNTTGKADESYATVTSPGQGVCEVCHTKTQNADSSPRFRNTGESDGGKHYTTRCTGCHPHSKGFAAGESEGGATCAGCHSNIWDGMTGAVVKASKHSIGSLLGTNDAFTDTAITWSDPLGANVPADRSCLNMCHQDHIHNQPGFAEHDFNVHQDAQNQTSRAVTRVAGAITGGTPDQTDFNGALASGGMCISCHQSSVDAGRPAIDTPAFDSSAHDFVSNSVGATTYDWNYTLHDNSTFERNCTKCHTDRGDSGGGPDAPTFPFGAVHFSDYPSLLAGSTNPNGTISDFVCYNCHGNGGGGTVDRSGKDIAGQVSKTYGHPTDSDGVHASVNEWTGAAFGNQLGGISRHVNCMDCHDPHRAKAGTHTAGTNFAGPPLEGAWGAELSSYPNFWVAPSAANFTKKEIVAGVDAEATVCFKCHSSFYGTLPTSPSGGYQETDTAREFNPKNGGPGGNDGSYHPVLASAGSNLGATSNIKAPWTRTSLMTCSDCHASNSTVDPNGPHGSTAGFLLKGPNTLWDETLQGVFGDPGAMPNGTFCINCHNQNWTNSRFRPGGSYRKGHGYSKHTSRYSTKCFNCHSAIPHGTARPGLLVTPRSQSVGGLQVTDAAPYLRLPAGNSGLEIVSYPANNTTSWEKNDCACGDDNWNH